MTQKNDFLTAFFVAGMFGCSFAASVTAIPYFVIGHVSAIPFLAIMASMIFGFLWMFRVKSEADKEWKEMTK